MLLSIHWEVLRQPEENVKSLGGKRKTKKEPRVDLLMMVEMRNWLTARVAADMSVFDMLHSKSLVTLAAKVATKSAYAREAALVPAH